jgi:hypothetical protein
MNYLLKPEPETEAIVREVVGNHLDESAIEPCNIFIEIDDDNTPYVRVGLCYKLSDLPIDPARSLELLSELQDALVAANDFRTPIIDHYFDDRQTIRGFDRACRAA